MGDEGVEPTIVSTNSSRDNFAGLPGAQDGSADWEPTLIHQHISDITKSATHNSNTNTNTNTTHPPAPVTTNPSPNFTSTMPTNFPSSLIVSKSPLPILPSAGITVPSAPANNTVPEFLYQLTKMLTGGHNDIIEWSNGRIEVHNPYKLESTVLQKYFRHSKFASFQRQLNYFGFRKLAGKGKMAPCSYVNEAATQDIGSLLLIKRKATVTPKDKNGRKHAAEKSKAAAHSAPLSTAARGGVVHQVAASSAKPGAYSYNHDIAAAAPKGSSQQAIAQAAVGRGIRHSIKQGGAVAQIELPPAVTELVPSPLAPPTTTNYSMSTGVQDSLSQLANNYQNSIGDLPDLPDQPDYLNDPFPSLLSRNSSLIDLAMIPAFDENEPLPTGPGMNFVDFPQPEVDPSMPYTDSDHQMEWSG